MQFVARKLPKEAGETLKVIPLSDLRPFELVFAPVYVFLKLNEKFVSIKGPLDFFSHEELLKIQSAGRVFFSPFVEQVIPFEQIGRRIRTLLLQRMGTKEDPLAPSSLDLSHQISKVIASSWSLYQTEDYAQAQIEPFFVIALTNALCGPLDPTTLKTSREKSAEGFELSLLISSWAVFLALHLGWTDLGFLTNTRKLIFESMSSERVEEILSGRLPLLLETSWQAAALFNFSKASLHLDSGGFSSVKKRDFDISQNKEFQKFRQRLEVLQQWIDRKHKPSTIFGEGGFLSVS